MDAGTRPPGPPAVFSSGSLARGARRAGDQRPSWVGPGRAEGRGWAVCVPTLSSGLLGEETPEGLVSPAL